MFGAGDSGTDGRRTLGRLGESLAISHLQECGYEILACNLRTPAAEVDLLARDRGCLVVVEVKTRRLKSPVSIVLHPRQRRRLARAAIWLHAKKGLAGEGVRVDLLSVQLPVGREPPRFVLLRGVLSEGGAI